MKTLAQKLRIILPLLLFLFATPDANAQLLKKLGKAAERAAERTVERRVEKETSQKTDEVLDSILEPGSKGKQGEMPFPSDDEADNPTNTGNGSGNNPNNTSSAGGPKTIQVYSKFDFVPGDKLLFFDDFALDFIGDFPSKWNSNGSGELVTVDGYPEKWLKILPGYNTAYIPDVTKLPEEFTLEFDVMATGLDNKTSSHSYLGIIIGDNNTFNKAKNYGKTEYSFCQFIGRGIVVENNIDGKRVIRNEIHADIRNIIKEKHHVSIAVNKQRFRFWINEKKYLDIPRLLSTNEQMQGIKFTLRGIKTDKEAVYISNIKIAEGGIDLRRKLLSEGKVSTNGILFDSGSANIQPQSMGIIRQISQVLQQESGMNLNIIGHTDADGNDDTNMNLSKDRAEAVKDALVNVYNVDSARLSTDGKGESEPVGDNGTLDGKAQNRRVEFIKM